MAAVPQERTASASLTELRTQQQPREATMPTVRAGFSDLAGFELVQRAAKALSASTLVPKEYQNNVPNCIVALELAQRIGASPLMVMQNLDIVHGRPTWRAQFVIACINQCGRYTELQYEWTGAEGKDDWACRAWAKSKSTGERVQGPKIDIAMAKKEGWYQKSGSKWQSIPELMLMYRAGAWFGRTNAPELTMGLSTSDEARDIIDVEEIQPGQFEASVEQMKVTVGAPAQPADAAAEPEKPKAKKRGEVIEGSATASEPFKVDIETIISDIQNARSAEIAQLALDLAKTHPDADYERAAAAYRATWDKEK